MHTFSVKDLKEKAKKIVDRKQFKRICWIIDEAYKTGSHDGFYEVITNS